MFCVCWVFFVRYIWKAFSVFHLRYAISCSFPTIAQSGDVITIRPHVSSVTSVALAALRIVDINTLRVDKRVTFLTERTWRTTKCHQRSRVLWRCLLLGNHPRYLHRRLVSMEQNLQPRGSHVIVLWALNPCYFLGETGARKSSSRSMCQTVVVVAVVAELCVHKQQPLPKSAWNTCVAAQHWPKEHWFGVPSSIAHVYCQLVNGLGFFSGFSDIILGSWEV